MKAIEINKKDKDLFIKASRIVGVDIEELRAISSKDKVFFFVTTYSQNDLFRLGIYFNNLCLEAKTQVYY
jgi:hypothetical protein